MTETLPPQLSKIVVIGGGHGCITIEEELLKRTPNVFGLTCISDDGGDSGDWRQYFRILPPGDATQRMAIRLRDAQTKELFPARLNGNHRFNGHRPMNGLLAIAEMQAGSHSGGIKLLEHAFRADYVGRVIPVSDDNVFLRVHFTDGSYEDGEHLLDNFTQDMEIDHIDFTRRVYRDGSNEYDLVPTKPLPNPEAEQVIEECDAIVLGPASFWGSTDANLEIIAKAIKTSPAPLIWVSNADWSYDTPGWLASDFAKRITERVDRSIDYGLINSPTHDFPPSYSDAHMFPVIADIDHCIWYVKQIYNQEFTRVVTTIVPGEDSLKDVVRHKGEVVADLVIQIAQSHKPALVSLS